MILFAEFPFQDTIIQPLAAPVRLPWAEATGPDATAWHQEEEMQSSSAKESKEHTNQCRCQLLTDGLHS